MTETRSVAFFHGKYDHENVLTKPIIANFFKTIRALIPGDVGSVLEVGCGPGHSSKRLSAMLPGVVYTASDVEPELVSYARELNPGMDIREESIYAIDRKDASESLVLCLEVMEHLEDPLAALRELRRVTKPGGAVVISVPNEPIWRIANFLRGKYVTDLGNTPGHVNHWTPRAFRRFIEKFFIVEKMRYPFPWIVIKARAPVDK